MLFRSILARMAKYPTVPLKNHPFTVVVEGNIGSGKTTFLKRFEKLKDVSIISEPIELWRDCKGHNLLGKMYEDPKQWSFTFQSYVQLTMLQSHTLRIPHSIKLMERSIYSARYCFVEKMRKDGILPPPSASVIDEWFKWIVANQDVNVDLIVYLRTTPEVVYQRIKNRNRSEEKTVPFEYIESLHQMHEDWLYHKTSFQCPAPVAIVDADLDLTVIESEYGKCESQILSKNISI